MKQPFLNLATGGGILWRSCSLLPGPLEVDDSALGTLSLASFLQLLISMLSGTAKRIRKKVATPDGTGT
jgi:hypothetical protein